MPVQFVVEFDTSPLALPRRSAIQPTVIVVAARSLRTMTGEWPAPIHLSIPINSLLSSVLTSLLINRLIRILAMYTCAALTPSVFFTWFMGH